MDKLKFWKGNDSYDGPALDIPALSDDPGFSPDQTGVGPGFDQTGLPPQQGFADQPFDRTGLPQSGIPQEQNHNLGSAFGQQAPARSNPNPHGGFGAGVVDQNAVVRHETSSGNETIAKNLEIISSKIDVIKAMIENINHRLSAMEEKPRSRNQRPNW